MGLNELVLLNINNIWQYGEELGVIVTDWTVVYSTCMLTGIRIL